MLIEKITKDKKTNIKNLKYKYTPPRRGGLVRDLPIESVLNIKIQIQKNKIQINAPKYKARPSEWPATWLSSKNTSTNTKNLNTNTRPFEGEARYVTCHLAQYVWNPFGAPTKNNTAGQMYEVGVRGFRIFLGKQIIVSKNYNFGAPIKQEKARRRSTLFIASTAFVFPLVRHKQEWAKDVKNSQSTVQKVKVNLHNSFPVHLRTDQELLQCPWLPLQLTPVSQAIVTALGNLAA